VSTFTFVRSAGVADASPLTSTATLTPASITAGDLVIASLSCAQGPTSLDSVTDSLGNLYDPCSDAFFWTIPGPFTLIQRAFRTIAIAGGSNPVMTAHFTGTTIGNFTFNADEYSMTGTVGRVGVRGESHATGNNAGPANSGSVIVDGNTLLFGWFNATNFTSTPPAGWTNRSGVNIDIADDLNVAAGTYSYQPSWVGGAQNWVAQILAFGDVNPPYVNIYPPMLAQ